VNVAIVFGSVCMLVCYDPGCAALGGRPYDMSALGQHIFTSFSLRPDAYELRIVLLRLCLSRFLQVRENRKKSRNLSGQGNVRGNIFEKSGKMKNRCHQMSDFQDKVRQFFPTGAPPQTPLGELTALPQTP